MEDTSQTTEKFNTSNLSDPALTSQPLSSKKSIWKKWIMITAVFLALLAVLLYFYILKLPISQPIAHAPAPTLTPTQTQNPTENWKTYTNEDFSLSFKYPANQFPNINATTPKKGYLDIELTESNDPLPMLNYFLVVTAVKTTEDLETYVSEKGKSAGNTIQKTIVNNKNGFILVHDPNQMKEVPIVYISKTFLKENNTIYSVGIYSNGSKTGIEKNSTLVNQILSTFKFTQ